MSIEITGHDTSFQIIWDELTLISVVLFFCTTWAITTYIKYRR